MSRPEKREAAAIHGERSVTFAWLLKIAWVDRLISWLVKRGELPEGENHDEPRQSDD